MPKGSKVLMVDDDKMLLDMYTERLQLAGYKVEAVGNGEECLAKIHQIKPDIVLLDIMMPKVNGYDTLSSIKSDPVTKDTPVIILSALVRDINKSRAIEAGADDYIIKSEVMPVDVIKKIENVLSKYHKDGSPPDLPLAPQTPQPPENSPPPPPPPPPAAEESQSQAEIEFEPSKPKEEIPPPPPPPKIIPAKASTAKPWPNGKNSQVVLFFLVLIVFLILASDIFFYLRFVLVK